MKRARKFVLPAVVATVALGLCATLVIRTSQALFSGTTGSTSNSWHTGSVALSNDNAGTAVFDSGTDGNLTGGQSLVRCLAVTFDGNLTTATTIKLYASAAGALPAYLNLTVDRGTGPGRDCSSFVVGTAGLYTGTVAGLAALATDYDSGIGAWSPGTTGASVVYRFTVTVQNVAGAQNKSGSANFTWEARG